MAASLKFLGHTTIYLNLDNVHLIIDPHFGRKLHFLKRKDQPIFNFEELHNVDAILISHLNKHRFDLSSFCYFKQSTQIILPLGRGKLLNKHFQFHVSELKGGAQTTIGNCEIHAIKTLNNKGINYIIKSNTLTIFYATDSKYDGAYFYDIGKKYNIDLAILPIAPVCPTLFSKGNMNSKQALQAFQDLKAKKMVPNCFGSFSYSGHSTEKIIEAFQKEINQLDLLDQVQILRAGEEIDIS